MGIIKKLIGYQRKTKDEWVLLSNYGYGSGWEEETAEDSYKEIKQRLKEYRENAGHLGQFKIKHKRIKI